MSFDLAISTPKRPDDLRTAWEHAFKAQGFDVKIYPHFSPDSWSGGFLPVRVAAAPPDLIGFDLLEPAASGFEVSFHKGTSHLRTAAGRSTLDLAVQCIGGATLALICEGHYVDDQNDLACFGEDAIEAARAEIRAFVAMAEYDLKTMEPFTGW